MPQASVLRPHLLAPDNFTPAARTPWGGRRIVSQYKAALGLAPELTNQAVGEAWELSFGPELPSRTTEGALLRDVVASDLDAYLGDEAARGAEDEVDACRDLANVCGVRLDDSPGASEAQAGEAS